MKTEVYSWRLASEHKQALEDEARRAALSVAKLLEQITEEWLRHRRESATQDDVEQKRIRKAANKTIGQIASGQPDRSVSAKAQLRERLRRTKRAR